MQVTIDDYQVEIAESWDQLSKKQALSLFQLLSDRKIELLIEQEEASAFKRIEAAKYLLGLPAEFYKNWQQEIRKEHADDQEAADLIYTEALLNLIVPVTNFLFIDAEEDQEEPPPSIIRLALTKNHFPVIEALQKRKKKPAKKIKLYGPKDGLSNISLYELGMAFTYFETFLATQDYAKAIDLLALLYRPAKLATKQNKRNGYQGDRRIPYLNNEHTLKKRRKLIRQLPPLIQSFLIFWFASCRRQIIANNPAVFSAPEAGKEQEVSFGWGGILFALAGGLAHLDQIAAQPWQNGLHYLAYLEHQRVQTERQLKRNQRA